MRITLGVMSLVVLLLFYFVVYRPTRSSFSGWWTLALLCSGTATTLLLSNGSDAQVFLNPTSSAITVTGAVCVWFATRSLRIDKVPRWVIPVVAVVMIGTAAMDSPSSNTWAGNGLQFLLVGGFFAAAASEVWRTVHERRRAAETIEQYETRLALVVSGAAATLLAVFYTVRAVLFVLLGQENQVFVALVGTGMASVVLMVCLVAVTFTVSTIGWDQRTRELRRRVAEDDLTGLLSRSAFLERAQATIDGTRRHGDHVWLAIADLDHFKALNDDHGHAAGDRALEIFASSMRAMVRPHEGAGRLGGEEFGIVLVERSRERVVERLEMLSARVAEMPGARGIPMPTVSYGVSSAARGALVGVVLADADAALYRAKRGGRARVEVHGADR